MSMIKTNVGIDQSQHYHEVVWSLGKQTKSDTLRAQANTFSQGANAQLACGNETVPRQGLQRTATSFQANPLQNSLTQQAVRDSQAQGGICVDGMGGSETLGTLTGQQLNPSVRPRSVARPNMQAMQNLGCHDSALGATAGSVNGLAQAGASGLNSQQDQVLFQMLFQFIQALVTHLGQGQSLAKGSSSAASQAFGKQSSSAKKAQKSSSTSSSEEKSSSSKPSPPKPKPKPSPMPLSRPKPPARRASKPKPKAPVKKPKRGVKPDSRSPLALDVNGVKGIQTSEQKIRFDIDGDGKLDHVNDVQEGVLGFGRGQDGKELFGDNTDLNGDGKADGYKNGFEALRALAKEEGLYNEQAGDTTLDARDIEFLEQKYNFGMKQGYQGELESLAKHGVSEIELGSENAETSFHQGEQEDVQIQRQEGATFKHHGETKEYVDVWHKI